MSSEKSTNTYNECSSKYTSIMSMIYNVENNVERMIKSKEALFKYNECLYYNGNIEIKKQQIPISFR